MYDKRRNKQFFFGLKRIQHRDSIFHEILLSKLRRSRYFEARYLEIEKKSWKKIVYFRTPVALYIPKFIVKNKKKTFFQKELKSAFRNKSHTIEFLKTSRDSFSVMWRDLSIISVALESYDIALSINISHMGIRMTRFSMISILPSKIVDIKI